MEEYCFDEREIQGKLGNDPFKMNNPKCVFVAGPLIVGAGPSGLAAAACLRERNIPSLVLERSSCIASLWQLKTYDRLRLHLPKQLCELPMMPFPASFPTYPDKHQFLSYLHAYARRFRIAPLFNQGVSAARYDPALSLWRVHTKDTLYVSRWLVVATGENADPVVPRIPGRDRFAGPIRHTSSYKTGQEFAGKKVLVVGCGNSGMEVCLDLCNYHANPSLVVRDTVHILPREMVGRSTFGWSMWLLKWLPIWVVDWLLLVMAWLVFGDTGRLGLERPQLGPLQLKNTSGKTPVLDVGTLAKIKTGHIKICPGIKCLQSHSVEFTNGKSERFDAIILATGYKSNVPYWLKENDMFSEVDGFPRKSFPEGWKGDCGLYAVGFTKRGLLGASMDATRIAQDIEMSWREEQKRLSTFATELS